MKKSTIVTNEVNSKKTKTVKIVKTTFEWLFNLLCLALVIIALLMAIASISRTKDKNSIGISSLGNITYAPVATDSMENTIMQGDLAIGRKYTGQKLKKNDIITFSIRRGNDIVLNTHRIIEDPVYDSQGRLSYVITKGDNAPDRDPNAISPNDILSVYTNKWNGMGKPIIWLQSDPQHFFLGVVLPIILLFVIYAAIFIRALVNAALGKKRLAAATVDGLSEEDKKKLAEEYLAKLETEKKQLDNNNTKDESVVENKEDSKTAEDSSSNK